MLLTSQIKGMQISCGLKVNKCADYFSQDDQSWKLSLNGYFWLQITILCLTITNHCDENENHTWPFFWLFVVIYGFVLLLKIVTLTCNCHFHPWLNGVIWSFRPDNVIGPISSHFCLKSGDLKNIRLKERRLVLNSDFETSWPNWRPDKCKFYYEVNFDCVFGIVILYLCQCCLAFKAVFYSSVWHYERKL